MKKIESQEVKSQEVKEVESQEVKEVKSQEVKEVENKEVEALQNVIKESAKNAKCTVEQFKLSMLTLSKLKNYFSDELRSYNLATNHVKALMSIIKYVVDKKYNHINDMRDVIYSLKKTTGKKSVPDSDIEKIATVEIIPKTLNKKEIKAITF